MNEESPEVLIRYGAVMIDTDDWSIAFIVDITTDEEELFFNDWVPTGEEEPHDWFCANLYDGKIKM